MANKKIEFYIKRNGATQHIKQHVGDSFIPTPFPNKSPNRIKEIEKNTIC